MESNFRGVKISIFHPERTEMRYVPIRDLKEKVYRPIKMQNGIFIKLRSFMSYDGKEFPTLDKARIYNERYYNANNHYNLKLINNLSLIELDTLVAYYKNEFDKHVMINSNKGTDSEFAVKLFGLSNLLTFLRNVRDAKFNELSNVEKIEYLNTLHNQAMISQYLTDRYDELAPIMITEDFVERKDNLK